MVSYAYPAVDIEVTDVERTARALNIPEEDILLPENMSRIENIIRQDKLDLDGMSAAFPCHNPQLVEKNRRDIITAQRLLTRQGLHTGRMVVTNHSPCKHHGHASTFQVRWTSSITGHEMSLAIHHGTMWGIEIWNFEDDVERFPNMHEMTYWLVTHCDY